MRKIAIDRGKEAKIVRDLTGEKLSKPRITVVPSDDHADLYGEIFDQQKEVYTAKKLAFRALNKKLENPHLAPDSLIKMVTQPHFPKTSVHLEAKIDGMNAEQLIEFMKSSQSKSEV